MAGQNLPIGLQPMFLQEADNTPREGSPTWDAPEDGKNAPPGGRIQLACDCLAAQVRSNQGINNDCRAVGTTVVTLSLELMRLKQRWHVYTFALHFSDFDCKIN